MAGWHRRLPRDLRPRLDPEPPAQPSTLPRPFSPRTCGEPRYTGPAQAHRSAGLRRSVCISCAREGPEDSPHLPLRRRVCLDPSPPLRPQSKRSIGWSNLPHRHAHLVPDRARLPNRRGRQRARGVFCGAFPSGSAKRSPAYVAGGRERWLLPSGISARAPDEPVRSARSPARDQCPARGFLYASSALRLAGRHGRGRASIGRERSRNGCFVISNFEFSNTPSGPAPSEIFRRVGGGGEGEVGGGGWGGGGGGGGVGVGGGGGVSDPDPRAPK